MESHKVSFYVLCLLVLATRSYVGHAQCSVADVLKGHNDARADLEVDVPLPHLDWNDTLADYAQNYANQRKSDCQLEHSHGPYGENLAVSTGDINCALAVRLWVDEKRFYDYSTNSCDGVCGHYTQVVWRNTLRVGCAKVACDDGGTFIGCNYDPPGNYIGERPY
ncbi:unnamed protein product [Sphenostylis stenocarpa]|uniref:SCP domain-containing protein n=1 Tax=Sphenostylis stenocarpa TaxID=92480 RepID=A0AA86RZ27_9FABA|nr:unnamed protein product [Sphenostylis stenocarpa]